LFRGEWAICVKKRRKKKKGEERTTKGGVHKIESGGEGGQGEKRGGTDGPQVPGEVKNHKIVQGSDLQVKKAAQTIPNRN